MAIGDNYPVLMGFDKAVPDGVATLDSVGNVPFEQLGNVVRPNFLHNGYFANPVDQRGGYVVPAETPYYSDTSLTTQAGTTTVYTKATNVNGTYGTITVDSTTYYVDWTVTVRGYYGDGYGFDRWKCVAVRANKDIVLKTDHGVKIISGSSTTAPYMTQVLDIPIEAAKSRTVTLSVLVEDAGGTGGANRGFFQIRVDGRDYGVGYITGKGVFKYTKTLPDTFDSIGVRFAAYWNNYIEVKAVKLEFGDTQTLAHQDADGNWVLNEIPDYGEELRKCQRYQCIAQNIIRGITVIDYRNSGGGIGFFIPLPVELRKIPALVNQSGFLVKSATKMTDSIREATFQGVTLADNGVYAYFLPVNAPASEDVVLSISPGSGFDANL